jgi:hypothetical protein
VLKAVFESNDTEDEVKIVELLRREFQPTGQEQWPVNVMNIYYCSKRIDLDLASGHKFMMMEMALFGDWANYMDVATDNKVGKIGRIKMQVKTGAGVVKGYGSVGRIPSSPLVEKRLSQSGSR